MDKVNALHKAVCDALKANLIEAGPMDGFEFYEEVPPTDDIIFPNICTMRVPKGIQKYLMGGEHIDGLEVVILLGFRERDLSVQVGTDRFEREALLNHYAHIMNEFLDGLSLTAVAEIYDQTYTLELSYPLEEGNDRYVLEYNLKIAYKA